MSCRAILIIVIFLLCIFVQRTSEEPKDVNDFSRLVRIDPIPQTQELVQQQKFVEAEDYLSYFMDYDYVNQNPQAGQLLTDIQAMRDGWLYNLKKTNSGFWSGDSDEINGQVTAVVSDFMLIGDLRDLGREGKNYIVGNDVDKVTAALSGMGVLATGAALVTAGTMVTAKPVVSFLKMSNKAGKMPKWLGASLVESAEIARKTNRIDHVSGLFSDIHGLYKTAGARPTLELLGKSKNIEDFRQLAKFGRTFGRKTTTLLKVVGDDAGHIYHRLDNVSKETYLDASTFGRDGVRVLDKYGEVRFEKFIEAKDGGSVARRRMTNFEKGIVDSGRKTNFYGQAFIKRDELITPKLIDGSGKSNIERMRAGFAPLGEDGNPINLHHMKQQDKGTITEISQTEHQQYTNILHRYLGRNESEIYRDEFNQLRSAYWMDRSKDFE